MTMRYLSVLFALIFICVVQVAGASVNTFRPVIIYEGSIEKNSFNLSVHNGVKQFAKKTGFNCKEVVVGLDSGEYYESVKKHADEGYSPIFVLFGNDFRGLVDFVRRYPATRFVVLDMAQDEPNVFSFVLAEHEGSFLAGALAAMVSKTKTIGFVSVGDVPIIRRFWCGYVQGAKYIDPQVTILEGFFRPV